jgi:very-short-patch-repair endonuclease
MSIEWANVNIEVDGKHHLLNSKQLYADFERDTGSEEDGIKTIRVPNSLIEENVNQLADSIAKVVRKRCREDEFF